MPQSLTQIYLHIIFSTKNRQPFLNNEQRRKQTHAYLAGICMLRWRGTSVSSMAFAATATSASTASFELFAEDNWSFGSLSSLILLSRRNEVPTGSRVQKRPKNVFARSIATKQSADSRYRTRRLLRGVYPEQRRRARNDVTKSKYVPIFIIIF